MTEEVTTEEVTTEAIIDLIFSELPKKSNSICLIPNITNNDPDETSYIFEMLVDIYMESVIDGKRLSQMLQTQKAILKEDVEHIDINDISKEVLELPELWFRSFGFTICVNEHSRDVMNAIINDLPNVYYRVILRDDPTDAYYFKEHDLDKPYWYKRIAGYQQTNKLDDISIMIRKSSPKIGDERYYLISFNYLPRN